MNAFRLLETSRHGARSPTAEHAPKVDARGLRHQGTRAAPVRPAMLGLGIALALAGCASLAPDYERPPLPVPDQYAEAAAAPAAPSAADIDWRSYFVDQRLQRLIEQALANNRDLRLAVLRVDEARAAYGVQRADRVPTIGASLDATRSRVPADLSGIGRPVVGNQIQLGIGLSTWELDFWGRVRSLESAALSSYLSSDEARRAATLSLIAQTAGAYLGLAELDERIALARQTVATRQETLRIFRRRVELGATSRLDLTQVEVLDQQAETLVSQLEQSRAAQAHALAKIVGASADLSPGGAGLDDIRLAQDLQPGLPSELLTRRPDIIAAEHSLRAANANIGAARAAFYPRISLTGALGTASAELDGLFRSGSHAWTFAPQISLPIFDGGRRQASLDLAEVRRDQAVVRYEQTIEAAFRDVSDALSAQRWLADQVRTLRETQVVQTERARLAKLRYDSGAARYLEVLDAERDLLSAQQQLAQTRRAQLSAQVALYAALGGGSQSIAPDNKVR